jgi:hypothetical protein
MDDRIQNPDPVSPESYWALDAMRHGDALPSVPGFDDAAARRLCDQVSLHDAQVVTALHDVPVPGGLAARILTGVQAELAATPQKSEASNRAGIKQNNRFSRRAALIASGAAVAAAVLIAVRVFSPQRPEVTPSELMETAIGRFNAERNARLANHDMKSAPSAFPVSDEVVFHEARWRWIDDPMLGRRGVAHDLAVGQGAFRATLYVMEGSIDGLITAPPPTPTYPPTQGACAAAWQSGGLVYVLVVEGGSDEYQRFIRRPGGPIA